MNSPPPDALREVPRGLPADEVEFWQADPRRRHRRVRYERDADGWSHIWVWP